jgi:hypothetical protein
MLLHQFELYFHEFGRVWALSDIFRNILSLNGGNIDFLTSLITLAFFSQESLIIVLNNCIDLFILGLLWLLIEE